jgi:tetraacyldisaccharide 4'-kinase
VSVKRPWLLPLVPLYRVGVGVKNFLYDCGWLRVRRLRRPVISVGSLSAGGAGKTPVVMMLSELLGRHGIGVDVLTRGYGRGSGVVEEVDAAGSALRFGDEPLEMAKAGLRVFVGAERFEAGTLAESAGDARVHLLDDGFQHRRLGRSLDVVLLTAQELRDWPLPVGNSRENLSALRRAQVIVVREEENSKALKALVRFGTSSDLWVVRRSLEIPAERPKRPVAFCGIARPEGFAAMLKDAGVEVAGMVVFPDHHAYSEEDFGRLVEAARHVGADGFVTTAKDAVKISAEATKRLEEVGPVWVARLQVRLVDEDAAMTRLREVVAR